MPATPRRNAAFPRIFKPRSFRLDADRLHAALADAAGGDLRDLRAYALADSLPGQLVEMLDVAMSEETGPAAVSGPADVELTVYEVGGGDVLLTVRTMNDPMFVQVAGVSIEAHHLISPWYETIPGAGTGKEDLEDDGAAHAAAEEVVDAVEDLLDEANRLLPAFFAARRRTRCTGRRQARAAWRRRVRVAWRDRAAWVWGGE